MGTRNLTKVIKDGKVVVAQYGQWDGYPSGQGTTAFYAVNNPDTMAGLEANLNLIYYPSDSEREAIVKPFLDGSLPGYMTFDSGKSFGEAYPSLTRDTGADILNFIANATEPVPLVLDIEFENDDVFCEGVFEVNLDNQTYRSWCNGDEVVMTFDEVRTLGLREYFIRFGYSESDADEMVDRIDRYNQQVA